MGLTLGRAIQRSPSEFGTYLAQWYAATMRERVQESFRLAMGVCGDMAGALERGRLKPGDIRRWQSVLLLASKILEELGNGKP